MVPAVVLVVAADGVFEAETIGGFGFVVVLAIVRFGLETGLAFAGVGLDSVVCCSSVSAVLSIITQPSEVTS